MQTYACSRVLTESRGYCEPSATLVIMQMVCTHGDKGREQTAGACSYLGSVSLGPSLCLLTAQHGSRHVVDIARTSEGTLDV